MAARKSLITRVVSHFQRTALREVVFSGHLEPREGGGLDGCQMQPGIAADHRQETRNLSIFCIVFDRLQFSNTTKIYIKSFDVFHTHCLTVFALLCFAE